jgi:hypothetical protein
MPGKSKKGGGLETKKYAFKMEDLSGDGKVTQKDVLIGKGVLNKDGSKAKPANEMKGYQMNYKMVNKEGFKMAGNPAMKFDPDKDPNLSLITDPNLSGLDDLPGTGDNLNYEGENMNVVGVDVNKIFKPETIYTPPTRTADGDAWYASLTPEKRAFYDNKYIKENTKPTGNKTLDSFNAVVNLASIPQPGTPEVKGDAFSNFDARQRERRIMTDTRKSKRAAIKDAANQSRLKYSQDRVVTGEDNKKQTIKALEGKELRKQIRKDKKVGKIKAKATQSAEKVKRLGVLSDQMKKQESQGINTDVGKKGRVTLQAGIPGSSTTNALPNVKEYFNSANVKFQKNLLAGGGGKGMKPMQLSPKAMNYFNKKKK